MITMMITMMLVIQEYVQRVRNVLHLILPVYCHKSGASLIVSAMVV